MKIKIEVLRKCHGFKYRKMALNKAIDLTLEKVKEVIDDLNYDWSERANELPENQELARANCSGVIIACKELNKKLGLK